MIEFNVNEQCVRAHHSFRPVDRGGTRKCIHCGGIMKDYHGFAVGLLRSIRAKIDSRNAVTDHWVYTTLLHKEKEQPVLSWSDSWSVGVIPSGHMAGKLWLAFHHSGEFTHAETDNHADLVGLSVDDFIQIISFTQ